MMNMKIWSRYIEMQKVKSVERKGRRIYGVNNVKEENV